MEIIIGSAVSLLIQWAKTSLKLGEYQTLGALLILSIAAAGVYTYLDTAGLWETTYQVLVTAGAFYTFIIKRFPGT